MNGKVSYIEIATFFIPWCGQYIVGFEHEVNTAGCTVAQVVCVNTVENI